jgi:hypothetical protein
MYSIVETGSSLSSSDSGFSQEGDLSKESKVVKSINSLDLGKRKRVVVKLPDGTYSHGNYNKC